MTTVADRIATLLRVIISTDQIGEADAAIKALQRTLQKAGLDCHSVADAFLAGCNKPQATKIEDEDDGVEPDFENAWRQVAEYCITRQDQLTERDRKFLRSIRHYRKDHLSPAQINWLRDIYLRLLD